MCITSDYYDFEGKLCGKTKNRLPKPGFKATGAINDVKCIDKVAHDKDALVLVAGAQSVLHLPVDVQELNTDFLAFPGHKMLVQQTSAYYTAK